MNDEQESELEPDPATDKDNPGQGAADEMGEVDETKRLEQEIKTLKEEVLRARAEVENIRKRAERDVEAAHKYGLERLIQEVLPVKDSMDLGLAAADSATEIETLKEGMAMSVKMFEDFFEKLHIKALDPEGGRFDPEFHQAMSTEESTDIAPGLVLRVMQKGYVLNDRLVRPALVVVAKAPTSSDA